eukprot:TRINITY_DN8235_c0_g1_i1.p1 TRINITY_DN8235_c0_g1~~TRINITY_DN8235_c0_g1_i1.p1  ORF type:complete len:135 (-),score=23.74 TRINITY_DN8235_c0_g1_i1:26-430(-)
MLNSERSSIETYPHWVVKLMSKLDREKKQMDKGIPDRERFAKIAQPPIDIKSLRQNLTKPIDRVPPAKITIIAKKEESKTEFKTYACDKCRQCEQYEETKEKRCRSCGCDLIHHIRDGEESPVDGEEEDEWEDD